MLFFCEKFNWFIHDIHRQNELTIFLKFAILISVSVDFCRFEAGGRKGKSEM